MKDNTRGLFDIIFHFESLPIDSDPLIKLNEIVDWEQFRSYLKEIRKVNDSGKGRPPFDEILMFKVLILQSLHNVSDDRMEFLIQDRLSFMRFLGFQTDKAVFPDAKTIWLFKEQLKEKKIIEKLFYRFNKMISKSGFTLNSGNIVDATIVQVPKQRNSKDENDQIKEGNIPEDWKKSPNKLSQKDTEARWIKKNGVNSYGYKNHILADMKTKLIKDYNISSANIYDGVGGVPLLLKLKKGEFIYGDSAYSNSKEFINYLLTKKLVPKLCGKGYRNRPLTKTIQKENYKISRIRSRVEHIFGDIKSFSNLRIRSIGIDRACLNIGLQCLLYNMRRYCILIG
jgi:IS5 family transposase